MEKKAALVLSGGGAKGAFQVMAEKYAREVKGYRWDVIAGVSVGALNGVMLAMEKYERLEDLWRNITRDQVYTGRFNAWAIIKLLFGKLSVYDNAPLWDILEQEVRLRKIKVDLRIGAVSLTTGEYVRFKPLDAGFKKAVLASTSIPLYWNPVDVSPEHPCMVDGGLRNINPIGDVMDSDPDEIVIITCTSTTRPPRLMEPVKNALHIGMHALEIALDEIFISDFDQFLRINHLVSEADAENVKLQKRTGGRYKRYSYKIIEPAGDLGDMMDFSRKAIDRRMEAGWEQARAALG